MTEKKKYLPIAAIAAVALVAAACGGNDGGPAASSSSVPATTVATAGTPPSTGTIAGVPQTTGLMAALSGALEGDATMKEHPIPAGMYWVVGGVRFDCAAGGADCVVSITVTRNEDGDITAVDMDWTQAEVTATFVDPLANMNAANPDVLGGIMGIALNAPAAPEDDPATPAGADTDATLGGLKNGMLGVSEVTDIGAADNSAVSLSAAVDPNVDPDDDMLTAADDDIGAMMAGAVGLDGWSHKVLHADWGDTKEPDRDGGFETAALIYSNLDEPGEVAFADAAMTVASDEVRPWLTLVANEDTPAQMQVEIDTTSDAWATPTANILFTVEGPDIAELTREIEMNGVIRGTYFGADGTFTCTSTEPCTITRETTGTTPFSASTTRGGTWTFVPDADAMVSLPDQDWLAFGFWLTAPDDIEDGMHRIGVFSDGMEEYDYSTKTASGLVGTATYEGSAAGYYVNRGESGLFTAAANLTANFEDDMLSGRINDFRNSRGEFIDSDTRDDPNDPMSGGEGDWTVELRPTAINDTGGFDAPGGAIRGSADGVLWDGGEWDAQLYGPGGRVYPEEAARPEGYIGNAPSGVTGNFRAITADLDDDTGVEYKGVVGAFGATLDEHTAPAPAATN